MTIVGRWAVFLLVHGSALWATTAHALDPSKTFYQYHFYSPAEHLNIPWETLDVVEDHDGFLWLATARGLIRYDGVKAEAFRLVDHAAMLSNRPTRLFVDSRNRLFVASEAGTSVYDGGGFVALRDGPSASTQALAFAEGPGPALWMATESSLLRYDLDDLTAPPRSYALANVNALLVKDKQLYAGGAGTLSTIEGSSINSIALPALYSGNTIRDLELHQGEVWGATRNGLFRVDGKVVVPMNPNGLADPSLNRLLSDRDDNLWFAGPNSHGRLYPDGSQEIVDIVDETFGLTPDITNMYEDSAGRVWHTTRGFGVGAFVDVPVRRTSFTEGLVGTLVTAMTPGDNDDIFVATDQGVSVVTTIGPETIVEGDFSFDRAIRAMAVDADGRLWLGSGHGIHIMERSQGKWAEAEPQIVLDKTVKSISFDSEGEAWIGLSGGMLRGFPGALVSVASAAGLDIESQLVDARGTRWIGSDTGLARVVEGSLAAVDLDDVGPIVGLTSLPDGRIVAASADRGILIETESGWMRYDEGNGLPPVRTVDIEFADDHLWIITTDGVFKTRAPAASDQSGDSLELLPVAGDLILRPAHLVNCCRGENEAAALILDHNMYVATDDGVVQFRTDISSLSEHTARPYVDRLQYADETYPIDSDQLALAQKKSGLQIDYSAVQLTRGGELHFRYRLLGLSDEWIHAGKERIARFFNLPSGEFRFELQTSLRQGEWLDSGTYLKISRPATTFETAWFRFTAWTALVLLGLFLITAWLSFARVRHRQLETRIAERTKELNTINTRLRRANEELVAASESDPLTGLLNRRFLSLPSRAGRLAEHVPNAGLLAIVDVDHLKHVNDAHGHNAGDNVLRDFASVLQSSTREGDLIVRWAGDKFLLLCACDASDPSATLERVHTAIREHAYQAEIGLRVALTSSIGAVRYPLHENETLTRRFNNLLQVADAALYAVKIGGRDGWALLEPGDDEPQRTDAPHQPIDIDFGAGGINRMLQNLVDRGRLTWRASRSTILLTVDDTVTRLPLDTSPAGPTA